MCYKLDISIDTRYEIILFDQLKLIWTNIASVKKVQAEFTCVKYIFLWLLVETHEKNLVNIQTGITMSYHLQLCPVAELNALM